MNVLAVGMSHHTADLPLLERMTVPADEQDKVLVELSRCAEVTEVVLLSTCNRVEVYAVVEAFHAGLEAVVSVLARRAGLDNSELYGHLYVHYAAGAVEHLFTVAAGLDSMVVGEPQILGQVRAAYATGREAGTVGRVLHELAQQVLRVGKRVHAETGLDRAGGSVVGEALVDAETELGGLPGRRALVVGAGSMGGLAVAALRRAGVGDVVIANRTEPKAADLAATLREQGLRAAGVGLDDIAAELGQVDLVVSCTGSVGAVITVDTVRAAVAGRAAGQPLVICDLGLPRDVEPGVADLAGVTVVDLASLQRRLRRAHAGQAIDAAGLIVADELRSYLAAQRTAEVTPTVTALRRQAAEVVAGELLRLDSRLPDLDDAVRAELTHTVRRVVDKLLHTPTVRVKELASGPEGAGYAQALRELFQLDPQAPEAITRPTGRPGDGGDR